MFHRYSKASSKQMFVEIVEILIVHNHCVITSFCNRDITNYDCYVTYYTCDKKVKSNKILIELNSIYYLNMMK